ncbi:MAG: hypothetical protein K6G07_08755 [Lachnospiraceae bacterium]|nr:hypothetical protein [Lachnospiraceae bacterium]
MYIAVVADNIADRKQMERLLGRANDAVSADTGTLYVDSYGDMQSALRTPMRYELFFLDFTTPENDPKEFISQLQTLGAPGRIVVCQPDDVPFSYEDTINGIYTIRKPILVAPLHQTIKDAHKAQMEAIVPTIEVRSDSETYYVPLEKIVYATSKDSTIYIHLKDGSTLSMFGTIENFMIWVEKHKEFVLIKKDTVVNTNHVLSHDKREYRLSNGESISLPRFPFFQS